MNLLTNLKIDYQRWMFRRKQSHNKENDIKLRLKAIEKANKMSERSKKRLWVLKMDICDYRIFTKTEIKSAMRRFNQIMRINYYQTNEYIVHITKKPVE